MNLRLLAQPCALLLIGNPVIANGTTFKQIMLKVPRSTNAMVLIDVERTLSSPLAEKEGWGKKLEAAHASRPIFLPPEAEKLVMAAELQVGDNFQPRWELALMALSDPLSIRTVARNEGGYAEKIDDTDVVWTPSDAYFVFFADRVLGAMFPADRQLVSRWIRFAKQNQSGKLSKYLSKALHDTGEKVQMLLAIDLTDVIQPHELDEKIQDSPLFKRTKLTSKELIPLMTSLRGASLRVVVRDDALGQLKIEFDQDVTPLKPVAHDLVVQVMQDLGTPIDDIQSWKTKVEGRAILMQGPLSQDGMRRVFSVVELPSAKFSALKEEEEQTEGSHESHTRESSVTYFRAVDALLKDLQRDLRSGSKAVAAVMERYARRIDRMPILNVDDDLLDYGSNVAETLRVMALSKRQGGIQAGVGTAGIGGYSSYAYGYFGNLGDRYEGARRGAADRSRIKAEAMAASKNKRVEGSKLIADATAEIRRQMTKKYNVEF